MTEKMILTRSYDKKELDLLKLKKVSWGYQ